MLLNQKEVDDFKYNYNYWLKRYNAGCNYLEAHPEETDKYMDKLFEFKSNLESVLKELQEAIPVSDEEIMNGFKLEVETYEGKR